MQAAPQPQPLSEVLTDAYERVPVYTEFWDAHGYKPTHDVMNLTGVPYITKEDLARSPYEKRVVLPETEGYFFPAISGGTTASPTISMISQYAIPSYYRTMIKDHVPRTHSVFFLRPITYASSMLGASMHSEYFQPQTLITLGDSRDIRLSAGLLKEVRADYLHARASDAIRMAHELQLVQYNTSNIACLWISGEPLTYASINLLEKLYPNALIIYAYAMTEAPSAMGLRSSRCSIVKKIGVNAYHLNTDDYIFEQKDNLLVVTSLHILPTPIIRFVVSDVVRIIKNQACSCGCTGPVAVIGPRKGFSAYKIGGYTFNDKKMRAALATISDLVSEDYNLQITQDERNGKLVTRLKLTLRPIHTPTDFIESTISDIIRKELVVAGTQRLKEAEKTGRIRLMTLEFDANIKGRAILPPSETLVGDVN